MTRGAMGRRAFRIVVIALVCAMCAPFAGAVGSMFLPAVPSEITAATASLLGVSLHEEAGEEQVESAHASAAGLWLLALGESFTPEVMPPAAGETIPLPAVRVHCSPHPTQIFRPPIV